MSAYTPAQLNEAIRRAGFQRTANASDVNAAKRFGLGVFARSRAKVGQKQLGTTDTTAAPPDTTTSPDITQQFIDQLRNSGLLDKHGPDITNFDKSGFYNEADTRSLANQEYDPYYQTLTEDTNRQNVFDEQQQAMARANDDKARMESINAAGGLRSSAFQQEQANQSTTRTGQDELRRQAMLRSVQDRETQKRLAKEQFSTSRRGEAYQRYLQSAGAVTT